MAESEGTGNKDAVDTDPPPEPPEPSSSAAAASSTSLAAAALGASSTGFSGMTSAAARFLFVWKVGGRGKGKDMQTDGSGVSDSCFF